MNKLPDEQIKQQLSKISTHLCEARGLLQDLVDDVFLLGKDGLADTLQQHLDAVEEAEGGVDDAIETNLENFEEYTNV